MVADYEETVDKLTEVQNRELSIIRLSEPILAAAPSVPKRSSDASTDGAENPSPASLAADLSHYRELFSKLRFSYLEQVTKEKYIRAIVGDPPQIVEHTDILELEAQLARAKAELNAHKDEVNGMVEEIEVRGRDLSQRYEIISLQSARLRSLPSEISSLEQSLSALRAHNSTDPSVDPALKLPLPATQDLLAEKQADLDALDRKLKSLQQVLPRKTREADRLENELKPLEVQRAGTVAAAKEASRRKEEGERGAGDELELKGRWYRGVEMGVRDAVGTGA